MGRSGEKRGKYLSKSSPKELRSFALMQKNQKIKASAASLLAPCTSLFASQTRALRSNSDAPGHSVPVVRFTLTNRGRSYPLAFGIGELFLSPEDSSPVLRGAGSRSETEGVRCLPHHNIFCVYLRRKILRLYNHPAQEVFPLFNRICNPIVLIVSIFNPVIRCYNPSPLRGAPLQQGSFFKSRGYLPRHNISCVHLRRKILRLYNYPA